MRIFIHQKIADKHGIRHTDTRNSTSKYNAVKIKNNKNQTLASRVATKRLSLIQDNNPDRAVFSVLSIFKVLMNEQITLVPVLQLQ